MLDAHRRDELAKPFRLFAATSSAINIIPNDSCTLCMQLSTTKLLSHEEEPNSAGPIVVRCLASSCLLARLHAALQDREHCHFYLYRV